MRYTITGHLALISVVALLGMADGAAGESSVSPQPAGAVDPHAAHRHMMESPQVHVDRLAYEIPDVELIDEFGEAKKLRKLFSGNHPVVVNFIFTSCTTICPVMTATMLQLQKELQDDAVRPNYVSISIDPDYDTAPVMKKYAARYGADWTFLTGSPQEVMTTLSAFDAYRGNKVNHFALTLIHSAKDDQWTRVEGLTSAQELARIWRKSIL